MQVSYLVSNVYSSCMCNLGEFGLIVVLGTEDVSAYEMQYRGQRVWLLDTPGFNDTHRSDTEILTDITAWLMRAHESRIKLSGLIYLHNITHNRMEGSTHTYLKTFRGLCGDENLKSTILVTTMWDHVSQVLGDSREAELIDRPDFWGEMLANNSQMARHSNDHNSAINIVGRVLDRKLRVTLAVQEQMARGLTLEETTAGKEMFKELEEQRRRYEEKLRQAEENTKIALQRQEDEAARQFMDIQEEYKRKLELAERSKQSLDVTMTKLLEDQELNFKRQLEVVTLASDSQLKLMETRIQEYVEKEKQSSGIEKLSDTAPAQSPSVQFDYSTAEGPSVHYSGSSGGGNMLLMSAGLIGVVAVTSGCILM